MDRKIIMAVAIVIIIGLAIAGYFYWFKAPLKEQILKQAGEAADKITESATKGTLPSMEIKTNPLETAQDINPADQANPFKNIKTNPFE